MPVTPNIKYRVSELNNVHYATGIRGLNAFLTRLSASTWLSSLGSLFADPAEYLVSVRMYPFAATGQLNISSITIGGTEISMDGTNDVCVNLNEKEFSTVNFSVRDCGSIEIKPYFNNFLDYAPHTKIELYLPYIGIKELDPAQVMGKTINIQYNIDLNTGIGTAQVYTDEGTILIADGQVGIDIPFGATNGSEIARNLLLSGISAIGGGLVSGLTGNVAGLGGASMGFINNALQGAHTRLIRHQSGDSANLFWAPQNAFLIITRPKTAIPDNYNQLFGRPSMKGAILGNLTGLTIVDSVHVEGALLSQATQSELSQIESLLKEGVIL